jgi:mannan polymerase II complex MNN11 subunit
MVRGADGRPVKSKTWTWAKLAVLKHALLAFPEAKHFWYLDAHAVVTDFSVRVTDRFIDAEVLDSIMMRDAPLKLALPASAESSDMDEDEEAYHYGDTTTSVKTYKHTQAQNTHLVFTQGRTGVSTASFLFINLDREGGREYAHALLDHWHDPLCRSYQGYRARETAALNHILRWHPSFLARAALVPTTQLAPLTAKSLWSLDNAWELDEYNRLAYDKEDKSQFVAVLTACQYESPQECLEEVISL